MKEQVRDFWLFSGAPQHPNKIHFDNSKGAEREIWRLLQIFTSAEAFWESLICVNIHWMVAAEEWLGRFSLKWSYFT